MVNAPTLSVVVLTLNEARHVRACLDSARAFADELVVFDSYSADVTCELARAGGATVYQRHFDNFPSQRNAALDAAAGDWVFFLDADERANQKVGEELESLVARADDTVPRLALGWVPRQNFIFGKWIRHTGWSPDYQPRLIRKGSARYDPARLVHELVKAEGGEYYLREPIIHHNYESFAQFRAKQEKYTRFEAQVLFRRGVHPTARSWVGQPLREFARRFVTLQGFRDGAHGFALSALMGYYALVRQRMLTDLWKENHHV